MPARKPKGLITRAETKADKQARVDREDSLRPARGLPTTPPKRLESQKGAGAVWRRLMRMYGEIEAEIATRLDQDLLVDYCVLMAQTVELDQMRKASFEMLATMQVAFDEMRDEMEPKERFKAGLALQSMLADIVKLDARVDRKRALLHQWRQSLYLTPRARAGVAPKPKEEEEPLDELEMILKEAEEAMHGGEEQYGTGDPGGEQA